MSLRQVATGNRSDRDGGPRPFLASALDAAARTAVDRRSSGPLRSRAGGAIGQRRCAFSPPAPHAEGNDLVGLALPLAVDEEARALSRRRCRWPLTRSSARSSAGSDAVGFRERVCRFLVGSLLRSRVPSCRHARDPLTRSSGEPERSGHSQKIGPSLWTPGGRSKTFDPETKRDGVRRHLAGVGCRPNPLLPLIRPIYGRLARCRRIGR